METIEMYTPDTRLLAKVGRRLTQWRTAAPVDIHLSKPLLSITFDDAPKSATTLGARILDELNVRACFYVASDLTGRDSVMGRISDTSDYKAMFDAGHEIGAHTHSHMDCQISSGEDILADLEQNLAYLNEVTKGAEIESFAYPYGETSYAAKAMLASRFTNLRGILSGVNRGRCDRAQLRAQELKGCQYSFDKAISAIDDAAQSPGWLILFTHDVSETPSEFGVTPTQLVTLVERARRNGYDIVTPGEASKRLDFASHG